MPFRQVERETETNPRESHNAFIIQVFPHEGKIHEHETSVSTYFGVEEVFENAPTLSSPLDCYCSGGPGGNKENHKGGGRATKLICLQREKGRESGAAGERLTPDRKVGGSMLTGGTFSWPLTNAKMWEEPSSGFQK